MRNTMELCMITAHSAKKNWVKIVPIGAGTEPFWGDLGASYNSEESETSFSIWACISLIYRIQQAQDGHLSIRLSVLNLSLNLRIWFLNINDFLFYKLQLSSQALAWIFIVQFFKQKIIQKKLNALIRLVSYAIAYNGGECLQPAYRQGAKPLFIQTS